MIRIGPGDANDARTSPGVRETAAHRLGKFRLSHIVRATGEEQQASRGGYRGGEAGQLAIPAQRRLNVAARLREGRRIGDDDVETFAGSGEPGSFAKGLTALKCASSADAIARRCSGGECKRRL